MASHEEMGLRLEEFRKVVQDETAVNSMKTIFYSGWMSCLEYLAKKAGDQIYRIQPDPFEGAEQAFVQHIYDALKNLQQEEWDEFIAEYRHRKEGRGTEQPRSEDSRGEQEVVDQPGDGRADL